MSVYVCISANVSESGAERCTHVEAGTGRLGVGGGDAGRGGGGRGRAGRSAQRDLEVVRAAARLRGGRRRLVPACTHTRAVVTIHSRLHIAQRSLHLSTYF